jgi:hypothetical protein
MDAVTNQGGTAARSRIDVEGFDMAGKTGTAQVRRLTAELRGRSPDSIPWKFRDHALFIAFAPVINPRYAISVVVEHGGGGLPHRGADCQGHHDPGRAAGSVAQEAVCASFAYSQCFPAVGTKNRCLLTTALPSAARELRFAGKLRALNWSVVVLVTIICCIGFALLYSVAGGSLEPWAGRQIVRFGIGILLLLAVAMVHIRTWYQLAYPIYGVTLLLLLSPPNFSGRMGKGAERWIDIGPLQLQPSELMKLALILALSRFLHGVLLDDVSRTYAAVSCAAADPPSCGSRADAA